MTKDHSNRTAASKRNRTVVAACWILGAIALIEILLAAIALAPRVATGIRTAQNTPASNPAPLPVPAGTPPDQVLPADAPAGSQALVPSPIQGMTKETETEKPPGKNHPDSGVAAAPLQILYAKLEPTEEGSNKVLRIAIKSNSREKIDVPQVKVQVYFYDEDENGEVVPSKAQVTSRWLSAPIDWIEGSPEILEVRYLPESADPGLRFAGYVVAVYYKGDRDDCRSDPAVLMKKFAPKYFIGLDE
jgi:hypothetical protein